MTEIGLRLVHAELESHRTAIVVLPFDATAKSRAAQLKAEAPSLVRTIAVAMATVSLPQ